MARSRITLSDSALLSNYLLLRSQAPHADLIPMIKANAYGHGSIWAAQTLVNAPQVRSSLYAFGVATLGEALELRNAGIRQRIMVFSDGSPYTPERHQFLKRYQLEPVLSEICSLLEYQKLSMKLPIPAHVEVNTGMHRLGLPIDSLSLIRFYPESVFSHLAEADQPRSDLTRLQLRNFESVLMWARAKFPQTRVHLANSAAIWNASRYPQIKKCDLIRPGLSLYGVRPFEKASEKSPHAVLKRVMRFELPVLQKWWLSPGDQVGYGGTYQCRNKNGEWIATLGGGYADGVFRSWSSAGMAYHQGKKFRFVGRVSMDLCAIQSSKKMKVGDWVTLWGDEVDPYEQAGLAGTIPYEITTRIGARVSRIESKKSPRPRRSQKEGK